MYISLVPESNVGLTRYIVNLSGSKQLQIRNKNVVHFHIKFSLFSFHCIMAIKHEQYRSRSYSISYEFFFHFTYHNNPKTLLFTQELAQGYIWVQRCYCMYHIIFYLSNASMPIHVIVYHFMSIFWCSGFLCGLKQLFWNQDVQSIIHVENLHFLLNIS